MSSAQQRIPLIEPYLGKKARTYVNECFETQWISSRGHFIHDFEAAFAKYIGTQFAVAVSNGTTALHLSMLGFGVGEGDEVIVPDLTFSATVNAVLHAKATPVIVDIDRNTWNIDPSAVRKAVTSKTKAIIPVHLYGYPAEMKEIQVIAKENNLLVIEDAAEAHGAKYAGKMAGSIGDCGTFSFYGNKIITTGEGGMVTLHDEQAYNRMLVLRDHGMNRNNRYRYDVVGYNYRMTNPQAALGYAQLFEIEEILEYRNKIQRWYTARLQDVHGVTTRKESETHTSVNWLFTCLVQHRDEVIENLERERVESRPMFYPLHEMEIYRRYCPAKCENSLEVSRFGISLPTYYEMPESAVDKVCAVIRKTLNGHHAR